MIETFPITNKGDWLAMRRRDVTASEVAALFGKHPYRTALQVYQAKINGIDQAPNAAMRRGRILEPAVAEAVREERPGWVIEKAHAYFRNNELRLGATPDWLIDPGDFSHGGNGCPLETKTAIPRLFEEQWSGGPPIAWVLQTLVQMMLTDAHWGAIACLVTSQDFPVHIYEVERHPAAEAAIIKAVAEFWRSVERGTPPPADLTRDGEAIEAMFPRAKAGSVIDLNGDNELSALLAGREEAVTVVKNMVAVKDFADEIIKAKLGEHETGICGDYKITWRAQTRKETVIPERTFRVLRITELRGSSNADN